MKGYAILVTLKWGQGKVEQIILDEEKFGLGRSVENELVIPDPRVSRRHLEVSVEQGKIWLKDLGSSIGTSMGDFVLVKNEMTSYKTDEWIQLGDVDVSIQFKLLPKKIDPKKLTQLGLDEEHLGQIENLMLSVKEQVQEAEKKAFELSQRIFDQKKSDADFLLQEAQTEAQKIKNESEQLAKKLIDEANLFHKNTFQSAKSKADAVVMEIHSAAEKNLKESKEIAQSHLLEAETKAAKLIEKAKVEAESMQFETQRLLDLAKRKEIEIAAKSDEIWREANRTAEQLLKSRNEEAQKEADRIVENAKVRADEISKKAQLLATDTMESTRKLAQSQAEQITSQAQKEVHNLFESTKQKLEMEYQDKNREMDLWKKNVETELKMEREQWYAEREIRAKLLDEKINEQNKIFEKEKIELTNRQALEKENLQKIVLKIQDENKSLEELKTLCTQYKQESIKVSAENEKLSQQLVQSKNEWELLSKKIKDTEAELKNTQQLISDYKRQELGLTEEIKKLELLRKSEQQNFDLELQNNKNKISQQIEMSKKKSEDEIYHSRMKQEDLLRKEIKNSVDAFYQKKDRIISSIVESLTFQYVEWTTSGSTKALSKETIQTIVSDTILKSLDEKFLDLPSYPNEDVSKEIQFIEKKRKSLVQKVGLSLGAALVLVFCGAKIWGYDPLLKWFSIMNDRGETAGQLYGREQRESQNNKYQPKKDGEWKETYTDNILHTLHFSEVQKDTQLEKEWIKHLHKTFVDRLLLDDEDLSKAVAIERTLISQLDEESKQIHVDFVDMGVKKMRELEELGLQKLKETLKTNKNFMIFQNETKLYWLKAIQDLGQ